MIPFHVISNAIFTHTFFDPINSLTIPLDFALISKPPENIDCLDTDRKYTLKMISELCAFRATFAHSGNNIDLLQRQTAAQPKCKQPLEQINPAAIPLFTFS